MRFAKLFLTPTSDHRQTLQMQTHEMTSKHSGTCHASLELFIEITWTEPGCWIPPVFENIKPRLLRS